MKSTDKSRENKLRRWANRLGMKLVKSRARNVHIDDFGEFMIVDASTNGVCQGSRFELDLDDVETYLKEFEVNLIQTAKS